MAFAAVSSEDRKLNSELKVKFQRLQETLAKENLIPVIEHLFAKGIITQAVYYKLTHVPTEREQSRELLSILHNSQHPLAFVKVHEAMLADAGFIPILEQLVELKVCMTEPCSGTAASEHSILPELNGFIRRIFPRMGGDELHQLTAYLRNLGVDEMADLKWLKESHLTEFRKPILVQKLLHAIATEQMEPSNQSRVVPQNQTDKQQQSAEPTTITRVPKANELEHDQTTPTASSESKVREYQNMVPRVVHTLPGIESVLGVTSLEDELYVLRKKDKEQVDVYNTTTTTTHEEYSLVRQLSVPGAKHLCDMTSCKHYRCLYIADSNNCCVYRVELTGKVTKLSVNNRPHSLSVTSQFTVLNTSYEDSKLIELTTEGKQLRIINIQLNIVSLQHAIQLSNGQFVISRGGSFDRMNRVCIVDTDGHVTQSYGGHPGSATVGQLNEPRHLAVDKDEFIFVADRNNSRVLLLSPTLNFVREIVSRDQLKGERPWRLFLDVDRRRLYVAVDCRVVVVQLQ